MTPPARHVALVTYHFPPENISAVRRVAGLRRAFEDAGVRTSVLTSAATGSLPTDGAEGVHRTPDAQRLRRRAQGPGPAVVSARRLTRLFVPDSTAATWVPGALWRARRLVASDRPDAVLTTSPPESVHLVGLAMRRWGVPWVADLRDGWRFEPPRARPYLRRADAGLERAVARRAGRLTTVSEPIAGDLRRRYDLDGRVVEIPNGYDPAAVASATDESDTLAPGKVSLVYTGSAGVDTKDPLPLFAGMAQLIGRRPELAGRVELVLAGGLTEAELAAAADPALNGTVRALGEVEHARSLGLQRAADGLVLITPAGVAQVAGSKLYEYLAARRPILALAEGNVPARMLAGRGGHVVVPPRDPGAIATGLEAFVERLSAGATDPADGIDVSRYAFPVLGRQVLEVIAEAIEEGPG